jgi:hypothetical protein
MVARLPTNHSHGSVPFSKHAPAHKAVTCRRCINIERAKCDPFIVRQADGRVWFANRIRAQGRFADRVWAVLRNARIKSKCLRKPSDTSVAARKASASISSAAELCEARRWIPMNPLQAYAMRVEDARLAKRVTATCPV